MVRKHLKMQFRFCVICSEKAIGINFNAATCMSCKILDHTLHNNTIVSMLRTLAGADPPVVSSTITVFNVGQREDKLLSYYYVKCDPEFLDRGRHLLAKQRCKQKMFDSFGVPYCKAFFRRHAINEKESLSCPFVQNCKIDQITRKHCAFCRLQKCFKMGMKKESILTEEQRRQMKEKILHNRLLRDKQKKVSKRKRKCSVYSDISSSSSSNAGSSSSTTEDPKEKEKEMKDPCSISFLSEPDEYFPLLFKADSLFESEDFCKKEEKEKKEEELEDPCSISFHQPNDYFPSLHKSDYSDEELFEMDKLDSYWDDFFNQLLGDNSDFKSLADANFDEEKTLESTELPDSTIISKEHTDLNLDHNYYSTSSSPESPESSTNFLLNYLSSPLPEDNLSLTTDPVIESLGPASNPSSIYLEIGFSPKRELILPEKYLLQELTSACSVLKNTYTKIEYIETYDRMQTSELSCHLFNRLMVMCSRLDAFKKLEAEDQSRMARGAILEMAAIRSVLMYDEGRDSWCVVDDKHKTSVFIKLDIFRHFCTAHTLDRHKAFPKLFPEEWKQDNIIFDLLTALILFTPKAEYFAYEQISQSYSTYARLLHRYLSVKYASMDEADSCYRKLMANLEEMRALNADVQNFFMNKIIMN